jgi:hypothetical protein
VGRRILRIAREDDLVVYYGYDDVDRLTGEVWRQQSDGDQIYGFWYDYDAGHNRVKMRRESSAGVEAESAYYGYDEANALGGTGLGRMRPVSREVYTPPSTKLDTYYYYDENGSLVREIEGADATYYQYGPHGLVTRIAPPTGNPWNFYYDGQLNRYCIDKGGEATYYLWDGLNLLEERAADGSLIARYTHGATPIYGIGSVVEVERHVGEATYFQYLVMDHRGTAYKVTDEAGATQIAYTLDAFGRQLAAPAGLDPNVPNELVYQTNWVSLRLANLYLVSSASRLYHPSTGVYLQQDPLAIVAALNRGSSLEGLGRWRATKFAAELLRFSARRSVQGGTFVLAYRLSNKYLSPSSWGPMAQDPYGLCPPGFTEASQGELHAKEARRLGSIQDAALAGAYPPRSTAAGAGTWPPWCWGEQTGVAPIKWCRFVHKCLRKGKPSVRTGRYLYSLVGPWDLLAIVNGQGQWKRKVTPVYTLATPWDVLSEWHCCCEGVNPQAAEFLFYMYEETAVLDLGHTYWGWPNEESRWTRGITGPGGTIVSTPSGGVYVAEEYEAGHPVHEPPSLPPPSQPVPAGR